MYLERILTEKGEQIRDLPWQYEDLEPSQVSFLAALGQAQPAVIAELKAVSPGEGVMVADYQPEIIASEYERGGAAAISVLTDTPFFGGSFEHLARVKRKTSLPLLCKDFIIDIRQVWAARAHGADAVLVIMRIMNDAEVLAVVAATRALKMLALFEVFSDEDLERALRFSPEAILVNQRDLDTLRMDQARQRHLLQEIPAGILRVAALGISKAEDLEAYRSKGQWLMDAVLLGTSLMRAQDRVSSLQEFIQTACKS